MFKARGKLGKENVGLHYQSKNCDENRVVAVVHVGQSSQVRVWNFELTIKTPLTHQDHAILFPQRITHYLNELYQKEAQKICKARNCSHVQVDFRPTRNGKSEEHITVRNSYKNGNDPCS